MAHKKGLGSSKNGRDSNPKYLGVKTFAGQDVKAGQIIVRQRGTKFRPGPGTQIGRDDTIFAVRDGVAWFRARFHAPFVFVPPLPKRRVVAAAAWLDGELPAEEEGLAQLVR